MRTRTRTRRLGRRRGADRREAERGRAGGEAIGLEVAGVAKRFGALAALDDVSFAVPRGRMLGFLGPNGAGKTTAMRAIFGLVEPDRGELRWSGRPIGPGERMRFGYMPEERGLYPRMALGEQLAYFGALHGLTAAAARSAADGWLERLGLGDRAGARLEELSHGNQQRAQLAAAVVHAPELLVLDEPFAGLDPLAVRTLADVLRGEAARGAAVLFSSHQLELVEDICEDVVIVDHGRLVASGHIDALRAASRRRRITLRLDGAPTAWLPPIDGVQLVERRNGEVRLSAPRDVDPERVLAAARNAGSVVEFSFGPPSLAELFVELVAP
ncbi:MAG TPA: ATP-binding cassette domain-containing protein [Solirubrobacteraceae bacterium]|jgi:ABC-2 type transport system ATP-binding protein|nr:ATP-binding cassette domain-containing protein [Solirubrobacteraceae bacterium]